MVMQGKLKPHGFNFQRVLGDKGRDSVNRKRGVADHAHLAALSHQEAWNGLDAVASTQVSKSLVSGIAAIDKVNLGVSLRLNLSQFWSKALAVRAGGTADKGDGFLTRSNELGQVLGSCGLKVSQGLFK